ncbi:hypothetical protein FHS70_000718 [Flammeovirga yaeyamensis]|nr:hypothetical protein [Flammeovirga yaeyamensis]
MITFKRKIYQKSYLPFLFILFLFKLLGVTNSQYELIDALFGGSYSNLSIDDPDFGYLKLMFIEQFLLLFGIIFLFVRQNFSLLIIHIFPLFTIITSTYIGFHKSDYAFILDHMIYSSILLMMSNTELIFKRFHVKKNSQQHYFLINVALLISFTIFFASMYFDVF